MLALLMLLLFEVLCCLETLIRNVANIPPYLVEKRGKGWWSHIMCVVVCMQPWCMGPGLGQGSTALQYLWLSCRKLCPSGAGSGIMPRSAAISSALPKVIPAFEDWHSEQAAGGSCWGLRWGCARLQLLGARCSSCVGFWPQ